MAWLVCVLAPAGRSQTQFTGVAPQTNGGVQLRGQGASNRIFSLQASLDLQRWEPIAVLDSRVLDPQTWSVKFASQAFDYLDPAAAGSERRFYRFSAFPAGSTNDWKNQAWFPDDLLAATQTSTAGGSLRWIKFAILLGQPQRVFYQDSQKYVLHHDFARARLQPFLGMDRATFDRLSLYRTNQQVLLGTVLFAPDSNPREYGIQFAGRDPYPREMVARCFDLVRSTVVAAPGTTAFYFPTYEQSEVAAMDEAFLAGRGIRLGSPNRWLAGDQVYAAGWALGRLRFIPAAQIQAAYAQGRLAPQDILVTDGVPAEVPFVAGIVSTAAATPNSHVAILAGAYGIPFAYAANAATQARLAQLDGVEVVLQAGFHSDTPFITIIKTEGFLEAGFRGQLLALKQPAKPDLQAKARYGAWSASTDQLGLQDIRFFGGKASQYGILRRTVPANCPEAIAFSFDLWDDFLDQTLPGGKSLRAEISTRLAGYAYPPDMAAVQARLGEIRQLITRTATFNPAQKAAITNALSRFDPDKNVRFRSSSNAEDNATFSAAGLYDSFSGCLADDLDGDTIGPSHGDPTEPEERGVFRAMQKVYASFYNDNAFLERLRHGIDESQVGMALLVHYSAPDDQELANGVATVSLKTQLFGQVQAVAKLVTQAGAVSVTNPEGNARPEIVEYAENGGPNLIQSSSLVPLGSQVMTWQTDYATLSQKLFQAFHAYQALLTNRASDLVLDLEYKKLKPGQLIIKQVRPLPSPGTDSAQRYLLNEPTRYWVFQKEGSDVMANHRLKGFLTLESGNLILSSNNLARCLYTQARLEWPDGTNTQAWSGLMSAWPGAAHALSYDDRKGWIMEDRWSVGAGSQQRQYQLLSILPATGSSAVPFYPQAGLRKWLTVTYATPQPGVDWQEQGVSTASETVQLVACPSLDSLREGTPETFSNPAGVKFSVAFLSAADESQSLLGVDLNFWGTYPAYYSPWMHSQITGLTAEPLELRGYYSQSAAAGHKYRYAWYVFEPRLEPGLPPKQALELATANIQLIYVSREAWPGGAVSLLVLGLDGKWRKL